MANIEPFDYQKRTNIEEHNQLVNKVNEIVTVINDVNLDTVNSEIDTLNRRADKTDSDLASVQAKDIVQDSEIADLKPRVAMTESEITNLKTRADKTDSDLASVQAKDITQDSEIDGITKSLVSDVIMSDGTTMGSVQVSIKREDDTLITSKNYKWGRDIGIRLEAGTQAGYVKAVIDLSDGTVLESNEYRIVEVLESDIYVTAITLVADQNAGTLGGNISYSNGTTQSINTVSVPTAPGVTSALESLQSRMTAVEQKNTSQDGQITALDTRVKAIEDTPGVGQFDTGKLGTIAGSTADGRIKAETDGTGSVNGWGALKDRVTASEGQITELDGMVAGKVNINQGSANAGKVLGISGDGNVSPIEPPSGGEVWKEVDLNNWPTNWVSGDKVRIIIDSYVTGTSSNSWNTIPPTIGIYGKDGNHLSNIVEFIIPENATQSNIPLSMYFERYSLNALAISSIKPVTSWNTNGHDKIRINGYRFNGGGLAEDGVNISNSNITQYVHKMWRLKK